jgi:selenide, water dikinase
MAAEGFVTGASARNWASYGGEVSLGSSVGTARKALLTDPQTSGGLLVACAPEATNDVLSIFRREGFDRAAVIGELSEGAAQVAVV